MKKLIILSLLFCFSVAGMAQSSNGLKVSKHTARTVTSSIGARDARYTAVNGENARYTTVSGEVRHHSGHRVTQGSKLRNHPQRYSSTTSEPAKYNIGGEGFYTQQESVPAKQKSEGGSTGTILLYSLLLGGLIVSEVILLGSLL